MHAQCALSDTALCVWPLFALPQLGCLDNPLLPEMVAQPREAPQLTRWLAAEGAGAEELPLEPRCPCTGALLHSRSPV